MPNPLIDAIFETNYEKARELITTNSNNIINQPDDNNDFPLFVAIDFSLYDNIDDDDKRELIRLTILMLENGSLPNIQDATLATPMHYAVRSGSLELITLLVNKGADYNAQDCSGETPLHGAVLTGEVLNGDTSIVQYLLSLDNIKLLKLSSDIPELGEQTALDYSLIYSINVFALLFEKFEKNQKDWSELHIMGREHLECGVFEVASIYLRAALEKSPDNGFILNSIGDNHLKTASCIDDIRCASDYYKSSIEALTSSDDFIKIPVKNLYSLSEYCFKLGHSLYENADFIQAIDYFKLALDLGYVEKLLTLNQIGMANYQLQKFSDAKKTFNKMILASNPENNKDFHCTAWENYSEVTAIIGKLKPALLSFQLAKSLDNCIEKSEPLELLEQNQPAYHSTSKFKM